MTDATAFDTPSLEAETLLFQKLSTELHQAIAAGDEATAAAARKDLEAIVMHTERKSLRERALRAMSANE